MSLTASRTPTYSEAMTLDLPEMDIDGIKVEHWNISQEESDRSRLHAAIGDGRGRVLPGKITRVLIDGKLWMSDTPDEKRDHSEVFYQAARRGGRILINGLGAGMVLGALLKLENVTHIDVVELDERIIKHIGPHYDDPRVTIHHGDAYTIKWPVGTEWTLAWHDIWLDLSAENFPGMHRLHRRYGRRVQWQASWGREWLEYQTRNGRGWY